MFIIGIVICSVIGYFIGSFSWSYVIVKLKLNLDIRNVGSKNAGATNAMRLLGKKWGLIVIFLDSSKTVITALIAVFFSLIKIDIFSQLSYFIPCLFTVIGHCWPVYHKYKGGKAVSCLLGLLFVINVLFLFIFLILWFIFIFIFKKVSLSSIIAAVTILFIMWIPQLYGLNKLDFNWNGMTLFLPAWSEKYLYFSFINSFHYSFDHKWCSGILEMNIIIFLSVIILVIRHRENIKRLIKNKEPNTF